MAELDTEKEQSRAEVATYLRKFADQLDPRGDVGDPGSENDRSMTVIVDNESATITPPEMVYFQVEVDTDSSLLETGLDRGITFSLEWNADDVEKSDKLEVE